MKLPPGKFGAILADPPWRFETWSAKGRDRSPDKHYRTMTVGQICTLPIGQLAAKNSVLFLWISWPMLEHGLQVIEAWGFKYKTCAFAWIKADNGKVWNGTGFWTRANSEVCLLATRGHPQRKKRDVGQGIIAPRREHSRKPDCVHERIERLLGRQRRLELFARKRRPGWSSWGLELDKFK